MGEPRPVGEIVAEVLGELLAMRDGKSLLVVRLSDVRGWVRADRQRWIEAIRRGKSYRRSLEMARRIGGEP